MSTIDMVEDLNGWRQYLELNTVAALGHYQGRDRCRDCGEAPDTTRFGELALDPAGKRAMQE